jgi:predicted nuclease with TOPRIM domain
MDELIALEKSVYQLVLRQEEVSEEKEILLKELKTLKDENEILRIRLEDVERKSATVGEIFDESLFDSNDKEVIKDRIDILINKIDNHLRS